MFVELKYDGVSISLKYKDGVLIQGTSLEVMDIMEMM